MKDTTGLKLLTATWFAMYGIEFYSSISQGNGLAAPLPLIKVNILWTLLGFVSVASPPFAGLLSVGITIAVLVTKPQWLNPNTSSSAKLAGAQLANLPTTQYASQLGAANPAPSSTGANLA
jgi:hypothetical protein